MLERDIIRRIRTKLLAEYGIRLHKNIGGAYGETGAADLYGTLPGGRALYLEVKQPNKKNTLTAAQKNWLDAERQMGAVAELVTSPLEVIHILEREGIDKTVPALHN
jgi:hypothetical protein